MFFRLLAFTGQAARLARALACVILCVPFVVSASRAGPGHGDGEGHSHDAPASAVAQSPRVVASSESYQLAGVLRKGRLTLYLDRDADNAPVTAARLTVAVGEKSLEATANPDGSYEIQPGDLFKPGENEALFTINEDGKFDLLAGVLYLPEANSSATANSSAGLRSSATSGNAWWPSFAAVAFALVVGVVLGALMRGVRSVAVVLVLGSGMALAASDNARAGPGHGGEEGHSHGPAETAAAGDNPRRLPDGSVFLPKETQRLLEVRSRYVQPEETRHAIRFAGRIIADPNRSAIIQSTIDGRAKPVNGRFPHIGQSVKAGETLALVEPAFAAIDQTNVQQTAGDLDQQIAIASAKIDHVRQLTKDGVYSPERLRYAEVELENLRKRRATLGTSQARAEALIAPIDGVIAVSQTSIGQVVSPKDVMFKIVEPHSFWVEALVFDHVDAEHLNSVRAVVSGGVPIDLLFIGTGRTHHQHGTLLHFQVTSHAETLDIGHRVTVLAETGEPLRAIILPRDAVVRAPNGLQVVFQHAEPERFTPKVVRVEPIDGERVVVLAGVEPGDKLVVQAAPLVNQVR